MRRVEMLWSGKDVHPVADKRTAETLRPGQAYTSKLSTARINGEAGLSPALKCSGVGWISNAGKSQSFAVQPSADAGQVRHSPITIEGTRTHPNYAFSI